MLLSGTRENKREKEDRLTMSRLCEFNVSHTHTYFWLPLPPLGRFFFGTLGRGWRLGGGDIRASELALVYFGQNLAVQLALSYISPTPTAQY